MSKKIVNLSTSEVKTYKSCKRQWEFTSRNRMMVKPIITPKALALGTLWHEALASLYSGASYDAVWELVQQEMSPDDLALKAMLPQYYDQVLVHDLKNWKVLEVEHKFEFPTGIKYYDHTKVECQICKEVFSIDIFDSFTRYPEAIFLDASGKQVVCPNCKVNALIFQVDTEVNMTGAIDLIIYDELEDKVFGIEHKTCAKFRDDTFGQMDEQPRVYFEALEHYITKIKHKRDKKGNLLIPETATNGGIVISETKKLLRDFQFKRTVYTYTPEDHAAFWKAWRNNLELCTLSIRSNKAEAPQPNYFACQMCDFKSVCGIQGYAPISKKELLQDFSLEFEERTVDYLDEKNKLFDSVIPSRSKNVYE